MPSIEIRKNPLLAHDVWRSMWKRCEDPKTNGYERYGGKGIRVCARWSVYENFIEDMGPRPTSKHQLDRIDSSGDYTKDNCRWVTASENIRNSRVARFIEWDGQRKLLKEWADELGVSKSAFGDRLRKWSLAKAMTTPVGPTGPKRKTANF